MIKTTRMLIDIIGRGKGVGVTSIRDLSEKKANEIRKGHKDKNGVGLHKWRAT